MISTHLKRITKSGWLNFKRNTFVSLSAVLVMVVTLAVIAGILLTNKMFVSTLDEVRSKVDINVYFTPDAPEEIVLAFQDQLENLPEVAEVGYITKEEALAEFKERHKNDQTTLDALQELEENPLGATLTVRANETSQYASIAGFLDGYRTSSGGDSYVEKINYFDNKKAIDTLTGVIDGSEKLGFIMYVVFALFAIVITLNTIRLAIFISKDEIHVMNLVGAEASYIKGPFVVTGAIYGIVSAVIVLVALWPLTVWLTTVAQKFFVDINFLQYYMDDFFMIAGTLFVSGIAISSISSYLAVRRYLRNNKVRIK